MRKYVYLALLISVAFTSSAQKPGAVFDVASYVFGLTLSDSSDKIQGISEIECWILKETDSIMLDLISKKPNGKGMTVISVKDQNRPLQFEHKNDLLTIRLGEKMKRNVNMIVTIQYEGIPADGLIITNNKYKHRGFFADNWPNRARNWLPCVDHPADKAPVDFKIKAPDHYQVVANGIQVEETSLDKNLKLTHYKETVPLSTKIMVIGVAAFAVQLAGEVGDIPVYSWVYPEDRNKGFYDYAVAVDILPWFIKNWGAYPYKKLANVQSKTIFGGLENANTIFYSEGSVTGTRKSEGTVVHEIAHQWFGDMATETDWAHLWLSEGFATYMTILYFENKSGIDTAKKMLAEDRAQIIAFHKSKQRPVVDTSVKDYMELLNANSYQKGGFVLHMLRQELGDAVFRQGIRAYYERYAGKNASTDDLRKVLEEISKKDLKQFFQQWLFTAGHPVLEMSWKYDAAKKTIGVTITQKQEQLFEFPLEIGYASGTAAQKKSVVVKSRETSFTIPSPSEPKDFKLDPDVKLLFEVSVKK